MTADRDANHGSEQGKRWVKPLVEEVVLEPTDDVLGSCWSSTSPGPTQPCPHTCFA
jgi:hypothetical protein